MARIIQLFFMLITMIVGVSGSGATLSVSPASQPVNPGDTFAVTIRQNAGVVTTGAQTNVTFDPNLLQITSVAAGAPYTGGSLVMGIAPQTPAQAIADANNTGTLLNAGAFFLPGLGSVPAGSADFLVITFQARQGVSGTSPITLGGIEMLDNSGDDVTASPNNGEVAVNGAQPPTSTPTDTPANTPTNSPTNTPTNTPPPQADTPTSTNTPTYTSTNTPTNTPMNTPEGPTSTPTFTATNTNTPEPGVTPSPTPTETSTSTATPTLPDVTPASTPETATATSTKTSTPTSTATSASTATATSTPANTSTPINTSTPTAAPPTPPQLSTATAMPTASPPRASTATPTHEPEAMLSVAPQSLTVPPGSRFAVTIKQEANVATTGAQTSFSFDPALLQVVSVDKSTAYARASLIYGEVLQNGENHTGTAAIAEANTTGVLKNVATFFIPGTGSVQPGATDFVSITLEARGTDGRSAIGLTDASMLDEAGDELAVAGTGGEVVVQTGAVAPPTPAPAGSGSFTSFVLPDTLPGAGSGGEQAGGGWELLVLTSFIAAATAGALTIWRRCARR